MSGKKSFPEVACLSPENSWVTRRMEMKQYGRSAQSPARPSKRLVDLADAAAYAACCRETIRRRIADGTLHGYRLGKRLLRVDLNEIDAALREIPSAATRYGEL
jgi:excisionase family DNA binding protein